MPGAWSMPGLAVGSVLNMGLACLHQVGLGLLWPAYHGVGSASNIGL